MNFIKEDFTNNEFHPYINCGKLIEYAYPKNTINNDIPVIIWKIQEYEEDIQYYITENDVIIANKHNYTAKNGYIVNVHTDLIRYDYALKVFGHYNGNILPVSKNNYLFIDKNADYPFLILEIGTFKNKSVFIDVVKAQEYRKELFYKQISKLNQKILECDLELLKHPH